MKAVEKTYPLVTPSGEHWTVKIVPEPYIYLVGRGELDVLIDENDHTITFPQRLNRWQRAKVLDPFLLEPVGRP